MSPPSLHPQDAAYQASTSDPESFWKAQAENLHWHRQPSRTLHRTTKTLTESGAQHDHWCWFPDGELSTTYNCIDRHVLNGNGNNVAIFWDSPVTWTKERITYTELLKEVETLAGVLREEGVKKGDVILIYSKFV